MMDRPAEARSILLESQRVYEAYGQAVTVALYNLGRACWRLGASSEALPYLERAIQLSRRQDDMTALVQELCVVAGVALDQGDSRPCPQGTGRSERRRRRVSATSAFAGA